MMDERRVLNPVRLVLLTDVVFSGDGVEIPGHAGDLVFAHPAPLEAGAAAFYVWPASERSVPGHMAWVRGVDVDVAL